MTRETFGAMLRRHRVEAGLSQNQLARLAGVDPAYVNRLERAGERTRSGNLMVRVNPQRHVVLGFAEALDLSHGQADRLLFVAGLAPQVDWQTRAVRAEVALASIRDALEDATATTDEEPTLIGRRTG